MRKPGRQDVIDDETQKNPHSSSATDQRTEQPSRRLGLLQDIAQEEARLARLEADQADSRRRLGALQAEMASLGVAPDVRVRVPIALEARIPKTSAEKVKLFRSLFRGREEVFPTRFVSKKTGKPGYAPACSNKWEPGLCALKTGGKCSECPNQAFILVDDVAIVEHLTGRHVMGVCPLLDDDTCWFLAVDFDQSTWTNDVIAFVEGRPSGVLPPSKTFAIAGWSIKASAWRSDSKRATTCLVSMPALMSLRATLRRGSSCSATQTSPMPPSPMTWSSR
jgi:hypothetical protein